MTSVSVWFLGQPSETTPIFGFRIEQNSVIVRTCARLKEEGLLATRRYLGLQYNGRGRQ